MKFFRPIFPILLIAVAVPAFIFLTGCDKKDVSPPWENGENANNTNDPNSGTGGGGDPTLPPPTTGGGGSNNNNGGNPSTNPTNNNGTGAGGGALAGYFPQGLLDASGNPVSPSQLSGKNIGIYFGAHWHPNCHEFTSQLASFRNQNSNNFEVVFVSLCNSQAEKAQFMSEKNMQWPTIPGARSEQATVLAERFDVQAIPQLVVLSPEGRVLTSNGHSDVVGNPRGAMSQWR